MRVAIAAALVAATGCVVVPKDSFEFEKNQIVVMARLNGSEPRPCLLDTGTNPSAVDAALAEELGLEVTGPGGQADGVGSEEVIVRPTTMRVSVAGAGSSAIASLTMDLAPLSKKLGRPVSCILGQSWLETQVVRIDYPRRVVHLLLKSEAAGASCREYPMRFWATDDAMPLVDVRVAGVDYPVTLDTGSSGTLKLFAREAPPAGIQVLPGEPTTVSGVRGHATVVPAKVAELQLGPISLRDVTISLGDRNLGEPPDARMGNLGNGILQHAVLTLDYRSRRLTICAAPPGGAS